MGFIILNNKIVKLVSASAVAPRVISARLVSLLLLTKVRHDAPTI